MQSFRGCHEDVIELPQQADPDALIVYLPLSEQYFHYESDSPRLLTAQPYVFIRVVYQVITR